jgi:acyl-CoA thioesterase-1
MPKWFAPSLIRFVVAALLVSACSAHKTLAPSTAAAQPPRLVVLGDSLAVSPSPTDNFVTNLRRRLEDEGHRWEVVNAGERGAVTADGVDRIDGLLSDNVKILVVELGANDGLRGVAVSSIDRNLALIIERAQKRGIEVLLCGMETPPIHGWDYSVAFHQVFPSLARRYGTGFVPFLSVGMALIPAMTGSDRIHPNAEGARWIAEAVWPHLEQLVKGIAGSPAA